MISNAALRGAAVKIVLHAKAREELDRAVVHVDREVDLQYALNISQDGSDRRIEIEKVRGSVELPLSRYERIGTTDPLTRLADLCCLLHAVTVPFQPP